jgi:hypothetical protein
LDISERERRDETCLRALVGLILSLMKALFPFFLGNKVGLSGKEEDRRGGKERFIYPSTMRKTERIPDSVSRRIGKHKVKK